MAVQDYKINYKSDFVLNINGDAGWAIPFCIKFWTGMPSQAYFVGFDGVKYVNCKVGDTPTQLLVMFDDHHLPIGKLKMQIAYHTTIEEFPGSVFDEVTNSRDVIVTIDGTDYQVLLDFTGEDAPELEFNLPAYANEAERIQNELQRQQNEAARIEAELEREQATAAAVAGAENVNAQLSGNILTVTNRQGVSTSVNTKGEQGEQGPVGPEGPQGEQGVSIVDFSPKSQTETTLIYTVTFSDGHTQDVAIPKGPKGDTGATGPTGPQGPHGDTGVSITGMVKTGETETDTLYNITFSNGTTQQVAIPKGEKGDQGPVGPQGPQGPMGDVAVITPEQQAAFTMYSTTGQNTNGPMTQKAVTDALVASAISYDNLQSVLAADNAQEALDEVSDELYTQSNYPFELGTIGVSNGQEVVKTDGTRIRTVGYVPKHTNKINLTVTRSCNQVNIILYNNGVFAESVQGVMPNITAGTYAYDVNVENAWDSYRIVCFTSGYTSQNLDGNYSVGYSSIKDNVTRLDEYVYSTIPFVSGGESELDIRDEESNILAQFYEGNFRTQKFDSAKAIVAGNAPVPLDIVDDNGRVITRFENGHIKTRNFDSSNFASLFHSNLYQKKMCIIGDSYVANHNQSYTLTWHYKIAQENEMTYVNYGINGNGLVASGSPTIGTPVIDRYSEMDDDADYVIVVGGKNDYNKQLSIASFKDGLASICAGLIDKYVARGSKIAFFTPWDDYDSGTDPSSIKLIEYVDAIIDVCGKYSIPVFDSSRKSSMFMFNSIFRTNYCQSSTDISHLNSDGHNLFKNKAFNFLNQL